MTSIISVQTCSRDAIGVFEQCCTFVVKDDIRRRRVSDGGGGVGSEGDLELLDTSLVVDSS